jgi:hypothetical protein
MRKYILSIFQTKVLKTMFRPKRRGDGTGGWENYVMRSFIKCL